MTTPPRNDTPFLRRAIARALFDLDISESEPSIVDDHAISSQPSFTASHGKATFLSLPVEIRLQIYEHLLISRFDPMQNPLWAYGKTNQKLILLHMFQAPEYRTMEPGILQTCKQIYSEGNGILYSKNVFAVSEPVQMFELIRKIGPVNLQLIRTLDVWVPAEAEPLPWLQLLSTLADKASGLRCIELEWAADHNSLWYMGGSGRGLGIDLDFVRALGSIQNLKKLVIKGYYAKNWPAYLGRSMGVTVEAISGSLYEEYEETEGEASAEPSQNIAYARLLNVEEKKVFEEYQEGTESLIP